MSKIAINLLNYANDAAFTNGDHAVTVKATSSNYKDSLASSAVNVTAFQIDVYGTADNPSETTKHASYKFVAAKGCTFGDLVTNTTDWGTVGAQLKFTNDAHEEVYLSDGSGDYSLSIRATDVIGGQTYKANWTTMFTQLATPTDVAISASTLSFTAVDHATDYEIYADGTKIGTHTP